MKVRAVWGEDVGMIDQLNHFCDIQMEVGYDVCGYNHTLHGVVV